ncbi:MAG: LysM domain-containing protein [Syntrophomonas sp.]
MSNEQLNDSELGEVSGGAGQRYAYYTVVHGDNIVRIAHYFKTTVQAIVDLNPIITDRNVLRTGWVLKVPDNR